ncbi:MULTISPECIES: hypothetical protein [unclassified Herbaspirillum]|uniref:hypothetical protein n=1 Tax=unclassified Herbaspirillum TaxID=2624150 RepID=UPI00160FC78F|nr:MULTISPECIES: hypothetical protein [unclassified Herbaspirillum]MBB5391050.1 hypothetical protein [Herbaspirillum sp. SJZ102]
MNYGDIPPQCKSDCPIFRAKCHRRRRISCRRENLRQAFLEAVLSGAFRPEQITGYKPSKANLEVIHDYKPALKIANDSKVISSYIVDRSGDGKAGGTEQSHIPRLKF